jgi:hypothetical protein
MLVIGVSYLVVPMFQLTPPYPSRLTRVLPLGLLAVLLLWSLRLVADEAQDWQAGVAWAGMALSMLYAGSTLWLQAKRRRRVSDATLMLWRGGMLSLLLWAASWIVLSFFPEWDGHSRTPVWFGVLALVGVFISAINGMLYKIIPFLIWLHLQQFGGLKSVPPNIRQMIPERAMRGQSWLHFSALLLLLIAVIQPVLATLAGVAFTVSCVWLEWNLVGAIRLYCKHLRLTR